MSARRGALQVRANGSNTPRGWLIFDAFFNNYPSESFRVLKNNEIRDFGEFRTARLVLQAWDRLEENGWKEN